MDNLKYSFLITTYILKSMGNCKIIIFLIILNLNYIKEYKIKHVLMLVIIEILIMNVCNVHLIVIHVNK